MVALGEGFRTRGAGDYKKYVASYQRIACLVSMVAESQALDFSALRARIEQPFCLIPPPDRYLFRTRPDPVRRRICLTSCKIGGSR